MNVSWLLFIFLSVVSQSRLLLLLPAHLCLLMTTHLALDALAVVLQQQVSVGKLPITLYFGFCVTNDSATEQTQYGTVYSTTIQGFCILACSQTSVVGIL